MSVVFRVEGLAETQRALRELSDVAQNRIARSAVNRGATPVVKRAKELVSVDPAAPAGLGDVAQPAPAPLAADAPASHWRPWS